MKIIKGLITQVTSMSEFQCLQETRCKCFRLFNERFLIERLNMAVTSSWRQKSKHDFDFNDIMMIAKHVFICLMMYTNWIIDDLRKVFYLITSVVSPGRVTLRSFKCIFMSPPVTQWQKVLLLTYYIIQVFIWLPFLNVIPNYIMHCFLSPFYLSFGNEVYICFIEILRGCFQGQTKLTAKEELQSYSSCLCSGNYETNWNGYLCNICTGEHVLRRLWDRMYVNER